MPTKKLIRHLLFWTVFFCTSVFNELSFSSSFAADPNWKIFLNVVMAQGLIYVIKMIVVYYAIYIIIPRWSASQSLIAIQSLRTAGTSSLKYLLEFIVLLLAGTLCIRLIVHYVVWPFIFVQEIRDLPLSNLMSRYLYSLFDLIPITLTAVAIKLVQLRISALKKETTLVHEKVKSELQYLKAQTNPHFLFNTLNGIYALSRKQDANAPAAIMNLSKLLRYMLYETHQKTNPIIDELALITDYIALQKLRFQEHMTITFSKAIDNENAGISPLLLLPLVENAFKHSDGLNTQIHIDVREASGILSFKISNTLAEHPDSDPIIKDGIGLSNIKRQLAILYKDYTFSAMKKENDFVVDLRIDLNSHVHV
jgi:sensor histidine kinase YesM